MTFLEITQRPDRHTDLLDAAEALNPCALIHFERGGEENLRAGNRMAAEIAPTESGDIGWQIVDVGLMLTRHKAALQPEVAAHLKKLLEAALQPWSDREFGRGNVNHPVIAAWLYAAAGAALDRPELSRRVDERLQRFLHIFSQAGDMSEYNSPTYLGPTLVGLASIGQYAALESARLRARLIEERIWLSVMSRWHAPSQQLAGPHSRAYADSTLGFGGIARYLAHAVLSGPVFWDNDMARTYDHNYDAEWAARIAACVFCFPEYLREIGESKTFPYTVESSTDGEDYTVDSREVYRGGWGRLTTYMTDAFCLGSSERPYVDGGQTEMCIAYWKRREAVRGFADVRPLYFRYVANERLPGQENRYYSWYAGAERIYSPNLLHQDGRQHVLQHDGKAIILAQPLKRENGRIRSLRFDALLPIYASLDEIWLGDQRVSALPLRAGWQAPLLIRDGAIFLALRPLQPTDLGGAAESAVELAEHNHHLIFSIYNLRGDEARAFPAFALDNAHNGLIVEIGSAADFGDFTAFRRHIAAAALTERLLLGETREVRYRSGEDTLRFVYNPATQEVLAGEVNGQAQPRAGFSSPQAFQGSSGRLDVAGVSLRTDAGVPAWLVHEPRSRWVTAALPTDQPSALRLETPAGVATSASFAAGLIRIHLSDPVEIAVETLALAAPLTLSGFERIGRVTLSGRDVQLKSTSSRGDWGLS